MTTTETKIRPRPELLDTTTGEACEEGSSFQMLWLEGVQHGFYLGTDSDSWARGLYWMPEEEHYGFYCFDLKALALIGDPSFHEFVAALTRWQENGWAKDLHEVIQRWDRFAVNRLLLTRGESEPKDYEVHLIETQTTRASRRGVRTVRAGSEEEAQKMTQFDHDDNQTDWGCWVDGAGQTEIVTAGAKEIA